MFNNLRELIATMPDEKACRDYLITERWNGIPICPYCGFDKCYVIEGGKRFKCASKACYKKFSVTIGTIFEASNIPLCKWLMAIYICTAHKKGISSYQLAKDIGISQKSSWFMLHRIRALMKEMDLKPLTGTVEADETYMSRKYRSDFVGLSPDQIDYNMSNTYNKKGVALGLAHPESGKVRIKAVDTASKPNMSNNIRENVEPGSQLHTDEHRFYNALDSEYDRKTIHHSARQWVKGNVTTNHVENVWSVMKRGVYGIYHQISYKHMQRYCDEFSYRYNSRKVKDAERFTVSLQNIERRLTYKVLVNKPGMNDKIPIVWE